MKSIKSYMVQAGMALLTIGVLAGCQDDFDTPPLIVPEATIKANTTIADLKAKYWQDDNNYYVTIPKNEDGTDVIVHGRVISSDATGNIYKSLVIQDETAALAFSVNQNSLYNTYRVGQEVVINVSELGIGKYAGLQQIGGYGEYNGTPQVSFMAYELFQEHAQLNGLPVLDVVTVEEGAERPLDESYCLEASISSLPTSPAEIQKMQSQLVIFRNVHFEGGGELAYSEEDKSTSRTLLDENGGSIIVRNSNYASFKSQILPEGTGDVRGILSYYNGAWQLLLRSTADCIFNQKGQLSDPYTVAEAIELQNTGAAGWTMGYIVGSVKAGVSDLDSNDKVIWGKDGEMDNTLVIGETADTKDLSGCIVMELPQGSDLRKAANLVDNPGVYGKQIKVRGTFASFMGTNGLTGNSGTSAEYVLEGQEDPGPGPVDAVGSLYCNFDTYGNQISNLIKQGWKNVKISGDKDWFLKEYNSNTYASCSAYKGSGSGPWEAWLISPAIDIDKAKTKNVTFEVQAGFQGESTLEVYVLTSDDPNTAQKTMLNANIPASGTANGYSSWEKSNIDLSSYSGVIYIAWRYYGKSASNSITYCVDNVNIGGAEAGSGDNPGTTDPATGKGSEDEPYSVADVINSTTDSSGVWVEGYVVGWIEGMKYNEGAHFSSTVSAEFTNTNCIIGASADVTDASKCIPAGIKAGDTRDILGLGKNPAIYKKHVKVYGNITKYFGIRGIKDISKIIEL